MSTPFATPCCWVLAICTSAVAALTDIRTGRIPNWLTGPTAALGIATHGALGGWGPMSTSVLGLVLSAAVPGSLYRMTGGRAIGGGDIKLLASLGALLGPELGLELQLGAFLLLAVFALIQLAFQGRLLRALGNVARIVVGPFVPQCRRRAPPLESYTQMRLGPAIAVSVLMTLLSERLLRLVPWLI